MLNKKLYRNPKSPDSLWICKEPIESDAQKRSVSAETLFSKRVQMHHCYKKLGLKATSTTDCGTHFQNTRIKDVSTLCGTNETLLV